MLWLLGTLALAAEPAADASRVEAFEVGVGVTVADDHTVSHVRVDGPGWSGGIRPGDRVTAIDGQATRRWDPRETQAALLGAVDAPVALVLDRRGDPLDVTVVRRSYDALNGLVATEKGEVTWACWCTSATCESGEGKAEHTLGWTYAGSFASGTFDGAGSVKHPDGERFVGMFRAGLRSGEGTLTDADGTLYRGTWDKNVAVGDFEIRWSDQQTYEGEVVALVPNGEGVAVYPDGRRYTGHWAHGVFHGEGTVRLPGGTVYTGAFQHGLSHGTGTVTLASGETLSGGFVKGRLQGPGKRVWIGGMTYEGDFVDSEPRGKGTLTWPDGRTHVGNFVDGKPVGWGSRTWPEGHRVDGRWVDRWRAIGRAYDEYGTLVYEGWTRDGKPEGWGREVKPDGTRGKERFFFNGKRFPGMGHPRSEELGREEKAIFAAFVWTEPFGHAEPGGPTGAE